MNMMNNPAYEAIALAGSPDGPGVAPVPSTATRNQYFVPLSRPVTVAYDSDEFAICCAFACADNFVRAVATLRPARL